jgi:hypothetical protein
MKNILAENMRRFGTKNLNEAPEFKPFTSIDDISVNVRVSGRDDSLVTKSSRNGNTFEIDTVYGEYEPDDELEVIIFPGGEVEENPIEIKQASLVGKGGKETGKGIEGMNSGMWTIDNYNGMGYITLPIFFLKDYDLINPRDEGGSNSIELKVMIDKLPDAISIIIDLGNSTFNG